MPAQAVLETASQAAVQQALLQQARALLLKAGPEAFPCNRLALGAVDLVEAGAAAGSSSISHFFSAGAQAAAHAEGDAAGVKRARSGAGSGSGRGERSGLLKFFSVRGAEAESGRAEGEVAAGHEEGGAGEGKKEGGRGQGSDGRQGIEEVPSSVIEAEENRVARVQGRGTEERQRQRQRQREWEEQDERGSTGQGSEGREEEAAGAVRQLVEMGFSDGVELRAVLAASKGSVQAAVERLMAPPHTPQPHAGGASQGAGGRSGGSGSRSGQPRQPLVQVGAGGNVAKRGAGPLDKMFAKMSRTM
jgi:hypothetical protein